MFPDFPLFPNNHYSLYSQSKTNTQQLETAPNISLNRKTLIINGHNIEMSVSLDDFKNILGPPSVIIQSTKDIRYLYDEFGVGLRGNLQSQRVNKIIIFYNNEWWPWDYQPENIYAGDFIIDGKIFPKNNSLNEAAVILSGFGKRRDTAAYIHAYVIGERQVEIFVSEPDKKIVTVTIKQ